MNLWVLLCLTKSTRFGYGAGLFVWHNRFKNTTRAFIITQEERLRSSHAKEVRYTRGTRKERKRFLFFTEKGIAESGALRAV